LVLDTLKNVSLNHAANVALDMYIKQAARPINYYMIKAKSTNNFVNMIQMQCDRGLMSLRQIGKTGIEPYNELSGLTTKEDMGFSIKDFTIIEIRDIQDS
jgi:hypothetical protein